MVYWLLKIVLTPILRCCYRVHVEGREHLPKRGPVIVAVNHRSFMDSLFVPLVIRRRVTFVAKAEYFDTWKTAWFFRACGQIPVRREGGDAAQRALDTALGVLQHGRVFGIYPEGTRTRDGYLHRGHTGVARLALASGAPIVPVGLIGTDVVQATDAKLPRVGVRVTIRFGEPIDAWRIAQRPGVDERSALRTITDEVMFEIQQLCAYEYRDCYATRTPDETAGVAAAASAA